jgi:hypothetical protein
MGAVVDQEAVQATALLHGDRAFRDHPALPDVVNS